MSAPAPAAPVAAPAAGSVLSADPALHLLRRATFGFTPSLLAEVRQRGTDAWLDDQLHPDRIDDAETDRMLALYPLVTASLADLATLEGRARQQASVQLVAATLARQVWTRRQLFEVMVDFWSNHFNVRCPYLPTYIKKPVEDRTVVRQNALGRFEDLLLAEARSPAMLAFLNNDASQLDDPNENYGRELLELHTVGVDTGYTETDVRNSAYVLTGRTSDDGGAFLYRADWHYVGPVRVLGWSSANASAPGGLAVGDGYLRYLARHPQTALSLSRKLAIRFVSDDPPQSLVQSLADAYLDAGTAIVPWLQALFAAPEFTASVGQKTRRPLEDLVATMRVLGIEPPAGRDSSPIANMVSRSGSLGQSPLGWMPPTGYPDVAIAWWSTSGTVNRANLHRDSTRGFPTGLNRPPLSDLIAGPAMATMGAMVSRLEVSVTGQEFRADHHAALLRYAALNETDPYDQRLVDKWLPGLTEMALNSAYHLLR